MTTRGEALIAETRLLWSRDWPKPICPRGRGAHDFIEFARGWICDQCGGVIERGDSRSVLTWWFRCHEQMTEAWVRN